MNSFSAGSPIRKLLESKFSEGFLEAASTILFVPFVLFLRYVGGTWLVSNHHYPSLQQSLVLASLLFGSWMLTKMLLNRNFQLTGLEIALVPFLVSVLFATIFSDSPSLSAEKALGIGFYFYLALLLVEIRTNDWLWMGLLNSILVVSLTTAALSLFFTAYAWTTYQLSAADLFARLPTVLASLPRLPAIANLHITISAAYYLMVLPLFVYRSVNARWKLSRYFHAFCILAILGIVILMRSRGSLIGLIFMLVALAFLFRSKVLVALQEHPGWSAAAGLVLVGGLSLGIFYIYETRGLNLQGVTVVCRLQAWKVSLAVLKENPLLGSGLETFGYRFMSGKDPAICPNILHVSHNDFLQILVNFGVLGLFSLGYFGVKYLNAVSNSHKPERYYSIVALAAIAGMGLVTTTLYSANIVFMLVFYLVWMLPAKSATDSAGQKRTKMLLLAGLLALFCLSAWTVWKIRPYYEARLAINDEKWQEAEVHLQEAIHRDPSLGYYRYSLDFVRNQEYCATGQLPDDLIDDFLREEDYAGSLAEYRGAVAALMMETDDRQGALDQLAEATRLAPLESVYHCLNGEISLKGGDRSGAVEEFSQCLVLDPSWLDTPYWDALALDSELTRDIISTAGNSSGSGQADLDLRLSGMLAYYEGSYGQAVADLDEYLQDQRGNFPAYRILALAYLELGDSEAAIRSAKSAVQLNPRCGECWTALAQAAKKTGDRELAGRAIKISDYLQPTPLNTIMLADLHAEQGDADGEYSALLRVAKDYYSPNFYSHWLSSRWHFDNGHNKCIPVGLTYQEYYLPITEAGERLAKTSCTAVQELFARATSPDNVSAAYFSKELDRLDCAGE